MQYIWFAKSTKKFTQKIYPQIWDLADPDGKGFLDKQVGK